jgi:hypothetical protein
VAAFAYEDAGCQRRQHHPASGPPCCAARR